MNDFDDDEMAALEELLLCAEDWALAYDCRIMDVSEPETGS